MPAPEPSAATDPRRDEAEAALAARPAAAGVTGADTARLLHELQVHQIELELQNESLLQARATAEAATQRYADLNARLEELVRLRTADLVAAREIAETANLAKTAFLANMSHELRTPMNGIMGMTELALRRATDARQIDQLRKAGQASRQLLGIINDILDLSKIEADRLTLEHHPFQLASVLADLDALIGQRVRGKGLALQMSIDPELACMPLLGDPMRLGQVLLNLLGNALKFTEHGSIRLEVALAQASTADVLLRFEVSDTGIGIPAQSLTRLFQPFEQLDTSTTRQFGGTGLGLAISKRLCHLMGGDIGVSSTPGAGSEFWFTVRIARGQAAPAQCLTPPSAAEAQLRSRHAGAHLLLAEDEPLNQEVIVELLRELGLQVDVAGDGRRALEMARMAHYDLILMDMQMPILNGLDATRAIRERSANERTPILALTANAFDEDRRRCLQAGMNDHLGKPVESARLVSVLLRWLPGIGT